MRSARRSFLDSPTDKRGLPGWGSRRDNSGGVLLNILPGFRELRAPLAAGYVWLLVGWLAFGGSISIPDQAQDFLDQFSAILDHRVDAGLALVAVVCGLQAALAPLEQPTGAAVNQGRCRGRAPVAPSCSPRGCRAAPPAFR